MNEMKNLYHYDENEFRSKMLNHEFEVPPMAWDDMAARLDDVASVATATSAGAATASSWSSLYMGIGLSLVVGAAGIGIYKYSNTDKETVKPQHIQQEETVQQPIANANIHQNDPMTTTRHSVSVDDMISEDESIYHLNSTQEPSVTNAGTQESSSSFSSSNSIANKQNSTLQIQSQDNNSNSSNTSFVDNGQNNVNSIPNIINDVQPNQNVGLVDNNTSDNNSSTPSTSGKTIIRYEYSISKLRSIKPDLVVTGSNGLGGINNNEGFEIGRVGTQWKSKWEANVIAGATANMPNKDSRISVNPTVGAVVAYNFNARNAVELGTQYKSLSNSKSRNNQVSYTEALNFGSQASAPAASSPVRSVKDLHMLEMPVGYKATLHPKHSVRVGGKVGYLVAAKAYKVDGFNNPSIPEMQLNRVNAGVYCGYEANMTEHLGLGVQYNLGLTNITSPTPDIVLSAQYNNDVSAEALGADISATSLERSIVLDDKSVIKVPKRLRNTDLQVYLRYRF